MDVKIVIATHKEYEMPSDKMYLPLEVGAACRERHTDYQKDDVGENISAKNPGFSELTGLYWAWKNLDDDYVGLVHYRRYFAKGRVFGNPKERLEKVLTSDQISEILEDTEIILPGVRKYYIENLYDHYAHTMYVEPLDMTGEIIQERFPEYHKEFLNLHKRKSAHMFNMMVMKKEVLNDYCEWLFAILFELERRVSEKSLKYDEFHGRFYGRVSELLLDVYIRTNGLKYKELKAVSIEPVNWVKKGGSFARAKITGKKYESSF
ncbi:DUF4422 domain-containing protein [Candidatus Saccharibacteria bacterium]|nr:DUF4422 domain-containing protein [Candidatus Saccharibacteria bacterium]